MLRSTSELEHCTLGATDGDIGSVEDFYFDDRHWVIRHLVVKAGTWLSSRKVLISPWSIREIGRLGDVVPVALTREQVKNSPCIDTDQPVSRQYEREYYDFYGYPYYWGGMGIWGEYSYPTMEMPSLSHKGGAQEIAKLHRDQDDPHLRSCNSVAGYRLHASDGEIGHVRGYLIDERSWAIRFLIVDTASWWHGHKVLIASEWISRVQWSQATVATDLTRDAIQQSPTYDPAQLPNIDEEGALYRHYERPAYREAATEIGAR